MLRTALVPALLIAIGSFALAQEPAAPVAPAPPTPPYTLADLLKLEGLKGEALAVALSPNAELAAAADEAGTVLVWKRAAGEPLRRLSKYQVDRWGALLEFVSDETLAIMDSSQERLFFCEPATGKMVPQAKAKAPVELMPDGKRFLARDPKKGNDVQMIEIRTSKMLDDLTPYGEGPRGPMGYVYGIAVSDDGKMLAAAHGDGAVAVWDLKAGQRTALAKPDFSDKTKGHREDLFYDRARSFLALAISPDNSALACVTDDLVAWAIEAKTGKTLGWLAGRETETSDAIFTPDGKYLLTVRKSKEDAAIFGFWDAKTGAFLGEQILPGAAGTMRMRASKDGKYLLTAGWADRAVRLFSLQAPPMGAPPP